MSAKVAKQETPRTCPSIEMPKKERERVRINFGKYSKVYSN